MGKYRLVLKEEIDNLIKAVARVQTSMEDAEQTSMIWMDPKDGHDSNSGLSPAESLKTWDGAFTRLRPGMTVMLRPGLYYMPFPMLLENSNTSGERPICFRAESAHTAVFDRMIQDPGPWKVHGTGVYQIDNRCEDKGPWGGYTVHDGKATFLPRYHSFNDLNLGRFRGHRMPKYGFAQDGDILYIKLPGKADPNERIVCLAKDYGQPFVCMENCSNITFEGIWFRGHGTCPAVTHDRGSHDIILKNCISEMGVGIASSGISLVECKTQQTGFEQFVEDFASLNAGNMQGLKEYVSHNNYGQLKDSDDRADKQVGA